ncbi:MrsE [Bacillus glycinifermentans]|uniref:ABC transporter permease n=1 Tax=Bacillus glycinifermentans TaxID=1664069 RepID=A0A0J6ENE8_9BACI|nr:ABC transporter permease [Bacillus glycinifermentans]ATH93768.1 MrsE [Bacillus glycinifermentans]KMM59529.1 MrsE [Bacillus glycinifermentans]KRT90055.1 MrsE [Bacillus glycinifermentans]MEC0483737.1 ABC transporter permease [Bacillus glycinifermentans]MEC0496232.1 ABC transporter permease [Bacillus glycinifermentans]
MLKNILAAERLKLKRSKMWVLYVLAPLISVILAYTNFHNNYNLFVQPGDNEWIEAWTQVAVFMGSFVLPILVGIYAAFVCRGEHIGGWKQLLALPVLRSRVFFAKSVMVAVMVAATMGILFILFMMVGFLNGLKGGLPFFAILGYVVQGSIASLPLIVLQLIVSIRFKTFGIPLAVSIGFTLPSILAANTPLGQIYPWALPMLGMSPPDESPIASYPLFYGVLIVLLILFTVLGVRNFSRRDMV